MKLTRHDAIYWTHEALDHAVEFSDAYGFTIDDEMKAWIAEQRALIDAGQVTQRRNPEDSCAFIAEVDGIVVGEVVVNYLSATTPEVDVAICKAHQGKGFAAPALEAALKELFAAGHKRLKAKILSANRGKDRVRRLLAGLGFTRADADEVLETWILGHPPKTDTP